MNNAGGRWITIGGRKGEDGKRHGGSPVFIEDGKITRGHPSLTGRKIAALHEPAEHGSHRQQLKQGREHARASWTKKARQAGIDPQDLHQLAGEIREHDHAYHADHAALARHANHLAKGLGLPALSTLKARASRGLDANAVRGLDDIAARVAKSYPELFAGHQDDVEGRLFELLTEGGRPAMTDDEAFEQALEHLRAAKGRHPAADDEAIPFSHGPGGSQVPTQGEVLALMIAAARRGR